MGLLINHQAESITPATQTLTVSATGSLIVPKGSTAARPPSPEAGMQRYNTDTNGLEIYNGSTWATPGQVFVSEVNVASASTTDLGAQISNVINITGNNTINSFGSAASVNNPIFIIRFSGTPTLTYNVTSMILPGFANITIVAGDSAIFQYLGGGNWKMLMHQPINARSHFVGGTVTGTANALVIAQTVPSAFQLQVGSQISFFPSSANTAGAMTLNINGTGAYPVKTISPSGLVDLAANAYVPSKPEIVIFNGTVFIGLTQLYYAPFRTISTNTSVAFADLFCPFIATAPLTMTLSRTSTTLSNYFRISIYARGGAVTLTPDSNDSIEGGSNGANFVIPQGANVTLYTDAAGKWWVFGNQNYAPLASPAFTGVPTAPTAAGSTNTTQIATTAFVAGTFAKLASPAFTGVPTAPTASAGTNTTQIATTAFALASQALTVFGNNTAGGMKLANGLTIQWVTNTGNTTENFTQPFDNACFGVWGAWTQFPGSAFSQYLGASSITTSGFNPLQTSNVGYLKYFAIGY